MAFRTYPITPAQFIRQHVLRMSVGEFAVALGVDQSAVSRYESVTGKIPKHHHFTVQKLAKKRRTVIAKGWFDAVPWDPRAGVPA